MGDVGHKLAALLLCLGQGVGHGVEGDGQLSNLVLAVGVFGDPGVHLAVGEFVGEGAHALQGVHHALHGDGADHQGDQQHRHGGDEEELEGILQKIQHGGGVCGHEEKTCGDAGGDELPGNPVLHQGGENFAGQVAFAGQELTKGGDPAVWLAVEQLIHCPGGDAEVRNGGGVEQVLVQVDPGGTENLALGVADQNRGIRQAHSGVDVVDKVLPGQRVALGDGGVGVAGNKSGVSVQGGLDFLQLVPVGQGEKARAQQDHAEDDQAQHHGDLAQVHAFRPLHIHISRCVARTYSPRPRPFSGTTGR